LIFRQTLTRFDHSVICPHSFSVQTPTLRLFPAFVFWPCLPLPAFPERDLAPGVRQFSVQPFLPLSCWTRDTGMGLLHVLAYASDSLSRKELAPKLARPRSAVRAPVTLEPRYRCEQLHVSPTTPLFLKELAARELPQPPRRLAASANTPSPVIVSEMTYLTPLSLTELLS